MPTKKVLSILIICVAGVASAWFISSTPSLREVAEKNKLDNSVSVESYQKVNIESNDDWKKILTIIDKDGQKVTNLTKNDSASENTFDETTLTAQVSKEFLSQYLIAKQGGKELTEEDIMAIAESVSSNPTYSKSQGPIYVYSNIKVTTKNDLASIKKYKENIDFILTSRSKQIKDSPTGVIYFGVVNSDENTLKRLDPIIEVGKLTLKDLLNTEVPSEAVSYHLGLMNSSSNVISNLEDIRQVSKDPVRAMAGIGQYYTYAIEFEKAINNLNLYFGKKLDLK
ncbi:MAG TPA: hypothetical protein VGC58_01700 [Candidatus Paceibacterota bacterium]